MFPCLRRESLEFKTNFSKAFHACFHACRAEMRVFSPLLSYFVAFRRSFLPCVAYF